jgi:class 3 adenylate cyclase
MLVSTPQVLNSLSPSLSSRPQRWWGQVLVIVGVAIVYVLVSVTAKAILYQSDPTPIWPPAGLALVAVFWFRYPGIMGVLLGDLVFNAQSGMFGLPSLLLSLAAVLQAVFGAWLLKLNQQRSEYHQLRDSLGLLLLSTFLSTLINPSLSLWVMLGLQKFNPALAMHTWFTFWLGDSMGVLIFAPVLLQWRNLWTSLRHRLLEAGVCFSAIVVLSLLVFTTPATHPLHHYRGEYLPFCLMIWAALRFQLPGATLASCLISVIAILGAKDGRGPFIALTPDFPTAMLSLQGFMIFLTLVALTLATAEIQLRATERQRANLSRYLPPNLVDTLANSPAPFGDDRQGQVALLYGDITGFASLVETLSPEAVLQTLRQFHLRMETQVFEHHGTLERYADDGLVAVFGAPQSDAKAASNALACARAMVREMNAFNAQRSMMGQPLLLFGVGLDYGRVIMGNVGSERCMAFVVAGKATKVVLRLKDLCARYQTDILLSKTLAEQVERESGKGCRLLQDFVSLGKQVLLGMTNPIVILGLPSQHPALYPADVEPTDDRDVSQEITDASGDVLLLTGKSPEDSPIPTSGAIETNLP